MPESNNKPNWSPDNPHPLAKMKTELVWEGKYDEYGNRRPVKLPTSALPLQRIETIDEPRDREKAAQGTLFDHAEFSAKAHRDDFRNMLIWGDNKLAMASLLERFRGKIDLIYIDPPFDVGADFTMQVQIGEEGEALQKEQSILEAVAYRDMWGKGTDSYLHMLYERLTLMRDLLAEDGSIFVHIQHPVAHYINLIMDELFGGRLYQSQIIWYFTNKYGAGSSAFDVFHHIILHYSKSEKFVYEPQYVPVKVPRKQPLRKWNKELAKNEWLKDEQGNYLYRESTEKELGDVWEIPVINPMAIERLGYETQKPEQLILTILNACSKENGLIADLFCGSGTTLAVAEKLGRRWIGVDLGRYAIHTTRKRLIQVQRELHEKAQPYRSFDVYNLGRYERQWWQMERLAGADEEHRRIVLDFYKAVPLGSTSSPTHGSASSPTKGSASSSSHPLLHGTKHGAFVHVDQIDGLFTFEELRTVAEAAQAAGARELHCLAWEFEMELQHKKQAVEAETGLTIRLKYIPREIMEPNRTECQFFEAGALEVKVLHRKQKIDIELQHFTPALAEAPETEMDALRKRAVKSPFDFIDFWAVDFEWHANKPFEHHWQDFRTRKDRSLKTKTDIGWEYKTSGKKQICVKVIDVFGVDTTTVVEVEV